MTEKFTSVRIWGAPGYAARGHVSYADAIARAVQHYQAQLLAADNALAAIRAGNVRVFHQTGLYRVHDRTEVQPEPAALTPVNECGRAHCRNGQHCRCVRCHDAGKNSLFPDLSNESEVTEPEP